MNQMKQNLLNAETPETSSKFGEDMRSLITAKVISTCANTSEKGSGPVTQGPGSRSPQVGKAPTAFVPLELETRFAVGTEVAAFHCNRRPQTLRAWACRENGPMRPINVNGRLAWPVSEIRRVLGCPTPSIGKKRPEGS